MIGLAFLATVIVYLDRQTLAMVAPGLKKEFQMSDESYGLIISAFMLAYCVMNGVFGPLLDRIGTRLGYALCMGWWSTVDLITGLATGPFSLGVFRFLIGAGEAGNWPAAVKVVSEWFSARERALAAGIFNSGAAIGAVIGPPLAGWMVLNWGWAKAFVVVGLLGYLWTVVWWFVYHTPAQVRQEVNARPPPPWKLLRTRFTGFLTLSKVFMDPIWYFYVFWFPKYLSTAQLQLETNRRDSLDSFCHCGCWESYRRWADPTFYPARHPYSSRPQDFGQHICVADDLCNTSDICFEPSASDLLRIRCNVWLHGLHGQYDCISRGCISQKHGRFRLGPGKHGRGRWRNAF
jgi:MFS family permease